jgi:DNA-binding IclR family transcriptional regulator
MIPKRPANRNAADILLAVHGLGGVCQIAAIHSYSRVERSTISHAMPGLVKHGYVEQETRRITLTEVGRVAVALILEARGAAGA